MRIDYSKSSIDIEKEAVLRLNGNEQSRDFQVFESQKLLDFPDRSHCILCSNELNGENFVHRRIPFVLFGVCRHVQTKCLPAKGYPDIEFAAIYPELTTEDYQDRKNRIYAPKLDWIVSCLKDELNLRLPELCNMRWVEFGSGAGYFISSLEDKGIYDAKGLEADVKLVDVANQFTKKNHVVHSNTRLSESFDAFPADIYLAFFVLEHIPDAFQFYNRLNQLSKGTILVYSVPVFGFSCLLENVFDQNYARNLDNVVHTQLYTDDSIKYSLEMANFEIVAQWIFGQDAEDFARFIISNLKHKLPERLIDKATHDCLNIQDSFQSILDRAHFSDQRHIIAIKR